MAYGDDKSKVPPHITNFFYSKDTGTTNLRRHLRTLHAEEYDEEIKKNNWSYKLSTQADSLSMQRTVRKLRDQELPPFSPATFLEHLVRFVVADDQVRLNHLITLAVSHVSSRSVLSNVLNSECYV